MSYYSCPCCNTKSNIFGSDGVLRKAKELNLDVLADIPLHAEVCSTSDAGKPITISNPKSLHASVYRDLADKVWSKMKIIK
jgi:ATP-binding protein involved in chromosome partitioning